MKIDVSELTMISEADYEPEVDMLRFVVNCRRADLYLTDIDDQMMDLEDLVDEMVKGGART